MEDVSHWGDHVSPQPSVAELRSTSTMSHVFESYLCHTMGFEEMRSRLSTACRALRKSGQSSDSIARFMRGALDRGAARALPTENVHRFNAIHDELGFWVSAMCTNCSGDDIIHDVPLADAPPRESLHELGI